MKRTNYAIVGTVKSEESDTASIFSDSSSLKRKREDIVSIRKEKWNFPLSAILASANDTRDNKDNNDKKDKTFFKLGLFWGETKIPVKQYEIFKGLVSYFTEDILRTRVVPLINRTAKFSLRLIDWFVVNYATDMPVIYKWTDGRVVNVRSSYQEMLDRYKRRFFDPFRRKMRLYFDIDGVSHVTTVSQLLYFRWAFQNGIIEYATMYKQQIYNHMISKMQEKSKQKEEEAACGIRHKRTSFIPLKSSAVCFTDRVVINNGKDGNDEVKDKDKDN